MALPFLSGAVEGFYGPPWTHPERVALVDWMAWGLNTYLYTPKMKAMQEWLPHFATIGGVAVPSDLILFADCCYLPHQEGQKAAELYHVARSVLSGRAEEGNVRHLCARLTELWDRPLFHSLARHACDLRVELDLFTRYIERRLTAGSEDTPLAIDAHLGGTYRGGMVARLQTLLEQRSDGTFVRGRQPSSLPE